jgi:ATP-dependent DNA ligase
MPEGMTLASFLKTANLDQWAMEEKFDGQRVTLAIGGGGSLTAWSRPSRGKDALRRDIPPQIAAALADFPQCTLDGEERIPGGVHSDVRDGNHSGEQEFMVFDIVRLLGQDTTKMTYDERRAFLVKIFADVPANGAVKLAVSVKPSMAFVDAIWARGGGGKV